MFQIKRADGYPAEFTAYSVREVENVKKEYRLQFLIFDPKRNVWDWVFAVDWIPA